MSTRRSIEAARRLADRYNREAAEIDRLERRLSTLRGKHRETYSAAMAALPDGAEMEHGSDGIKVAV